MTRLSMSSSDGLSNIPPLEDLIMNVNGSKGEASVKSIIAGDVALLGRKLAKCETEIRSGNKYSQRAASVEADAIGEQNQIVGRLLARLGE